MFDQNAKNSKKIAKMCKNFEFKSEKNAFLDYPFPFTLQRLCFPLRIFYSHF